jgi:FkbM family methyltransferase
VDVNPGELHGYYLYLLDEYASEEISKLSEFCGDARCFVDVGANVGLISLALAREFPQLEVFAFEPDPVAAQRLRQNISLNPRLRARIHVAEIAASDSVGEAVFEPSGDRRNIETGRLAEPGRSEGLFRVQADRLDRFFQEIGTVPDLVKIDVEGGELRVLQGMTGLFALGSPRAMLVEVHGFCFGAGAAAFKRQVQALMRDADYTMSRLHEDGWVPAEAGENWPDRCHIVGVRD